MNYIKTIFIGELITSVALSSLWLMEGTPPINWEWVLGFLLYWGLGFALVEWIKEIY